MVSYIDRAALIEQAALVAYDSHFPNSTPDRSDLGIEGQGILATLPVIAKALFAPLRELHAEWSEFLKDRTLTAGEGAGVRLCLLELGIRLDTLEAEVSA